MILEHGAKLGPYEILELLGTGGMGEVYKAVDTRLDRTVAVKISAEQFTQRFEREARAVAALNHPHICTLHDVGPNYLVMEHIEGPTLADRIRAGAIPLEEALPVARQIVEALEAAHEKGIIHRDLKPANIKFTAGGSVKVLDFGLAKALEADSGSEDPRSSPTLTLSATRAGVILGTAAYMSPEQARGGAVDKRADIWAFGVVLCEMLTAKRTFAEETVSDTLAAVLKTSPDWTALPPDTPAPIRRLLRRCLARDCKKRLPDIADARLEIDEALAGSPEASPPAPPPARAISRWWIAAVALIALAGVAVSVLHFRETSTQPVPVRFQIPAPEKANFGNYSMALSPDGRRLAFVAVNSEGRPMLWVRPLDSVEVQALPGTEGALFAPFWSPDSRSIGFVGQGKVKRIDASGGPVQTLCEAAGNLLGGSWSRDGIILFGSSTSGLFRVNQAGGVPSPQTTPDSSQGEIAHMRPWFLPDGRHFLYITRNSNAEMTAIYVATLDGKERKRLVGARQAAAYAPPNAGSEHGHLLFLRDGTLMAQALDTTRFELAGEPFPVAEQVGATLALGFFSSSANGVLAYRAGGPGGNTQLMWFDRDGKALGALGPPTTYANLALAPDGKHVAADRIDPTGNADVWVLDAARGVPTRFTFDPAGENGPVWSPDGNWLVFASTRGTGGIYDIYRKDAGGSGNEQLLLKGGRPEDISLDGRYLLYSVLDTWIMRRISSWAA